MYKVIKEYHGIPKGTIVNSLKESTCNAMVKKGLWVKLQKPRKAPENKAIRNSNKNK